MELTEILETKNFYEIETYCVNKLKQLTWQFDFDIKTQLPKLKWQNGQLISEPIYKYFLYRCSLSKEFNFDKEADIIAKNLDSKTFHEMLLKLLQLWFESGSNLKLKWILTAISNTKNDLFVDPLLSYINEWPFKSRQKLACFAVKALAFINTDRALQNVNIISKNFKFKSVKDAAKSIFLEVAKDLNLNSAQLADRIVNFCGLDEKGQRVFNYGNRKFFVKLDKNLNPIILNEQQKEIKNLPKASKEDNEELVIKAREEWNIMKKEIKKTIKLQKTRLEKAMITQRYWKKLEWETLFNINPLMNCFATKLIWGIYINKRLERSFYLSGNTPKTVNNENIELTEDMEIGIVHPIELDEEQKKLWKHWYKENEINQPFPQLYRKTFRAEQDSFEDNRFNGCTISSKDLYNKSREHDWKIGPINLENNMYYKYYRDFEKNNLKAVLTFSGNKLGYDSSEVTIYSILFFPIDSNFEPEKIIKLTEIPAIIFSETLYDVFTFLENGKKI